MPDRTADYFESHSQDYSPRRFDVAARWVSERVEDGDRLFDIGCGTGQMLIAMQRAGVERLEGCDVAAAALERAAARVGFEAHQGSILDEAFVADREGRFRFVTMSAVLHHLVGRTRRASTALAVRAVENSLRLLTPDGALVIIETCYSPSWATGSLFWVKRGLSSIGNRRIELGRWNNIGAPVVSFFSPDSLDAVIRAGGGLVIASDDDPQVIRTVPRRLGLRGHWASSRLVGRARAG